MKETVYLQQQRSWNGTAMNRYAALKGARNETVVLDDHEHCYPDAFIEHWYVLYEELQLAAYGVNFETFLRRNRDVLEQDQGNNNSHYRPLLPAQRQIQQQLDRRVAA